MCVSVQVRGQEREVTVLQTMEEIVTGLVFIAKDRQLIKTRIKELELSRVLEMMTRVWYKETPRWCRRRLKSWLIHRRETRDRSV